MVTRKHRLLVEFSAMSVILLLLLIFGVQPVRADGGGIPLYTPDTGTYTNEDASYPRVIRFEHNGAANGTLLATFSHSGAGSPANFPIYRSTDGGASWSLISTISATTPTWSIDAPTLFELPSAVGGYVEGTLFAAGTAWIHGEIVDGSLTGADYRQQSIEVFYSTDQGATWTYHSNCASSSGLPNEMGHGIWEPAFIVDDYGNLVCFYSDERDDSYAQVIAHVVWDSTNSVWGSAVYDVALADANARPGMSILVELPNGDYLMSYELCRAGYDPDHACKAYVKTSSDGVTWDATSTGTLVQTSDGRTLLHTPYVAWSVVGGSNGTLIMSGQRIVSGPDGNVSSMPENGKALFINQNLGSGTWEEIPAPFTIDPTGDYDSSDTDSACPGYSSPLLVSDSGKSVMMMAGTLISNGNCEVRFGNSGLAELPYYAPLAAGNDAGWNIYDGTWTVSNEVYANTASVAGNKSVFGSTGWTDYTLQGDVRLDGTGQAGLIFRVTDADIGADAYQGYYIGIEDSTDTFILGKASNNWTGLDSDTIASGINTGEWYHIDLQANGCDFKALLYEVDSNTLLSTIIYTDSGCYTQGQIGVRAHYTASSWRNISVTGGGDSTSTIDYYAPFATGTATGWTSYGGVWSVSSANESYDVDDQSAGDKSVAGDTGWDDYLLQGDAKMNSSGENTNSGLLLRVTNPDTGTDDFDGYGAYVNLDGSLVVGRHNSDNTWAYLMDDALPDGVSVSSWYRIFFYMDGCDGRAVAQPVTSYEQADLSFSDASCHSAGGIGVRTFNADSSWRYLSVSPY